ncbi:MAG: caspase family protein [Pseudomonadota bacterium]
MVAIVSNPHAVEPVYAFVVGVSRYRHLDDGDAPSNIGQDSRLAQLSSAARSASEFAAWVLANVPEERLAGLFLNVSPADGETLNPAVSAALGSTPTATRDVVETDWDEFYHACAARRDATVYVYAAGHGVQIAKEGAILLLEDFGVPRKPALWAALDLVEMNKTLRSSKSAALQYWFVDCCRERTEAADYSAAQLRQAFVGYDVLEGECTAAPVFFATLPREQAWARPGGVSLFNEALIKGLDRDAATRPQVQGGDWCVTTGSLAKTLNDYVGKASGNLRQHVYVAGHVGTTNEVIRTFSEPPPARLTISLNPTQAHSTATADIHQDDKQVVSNADDWPVARDLPAGLYIVQVKAAPDYADTTRSVALDPPACEREVTLS